MRGRALGLLACTGACVHAGRAGLRPGRPADRPAAAGHRRGGPHAAGAAATAGAGGRQGDRAACTPAASSLNSIEM